MTAVNLLKELTVIDVVQRNGLANIIYVKNFVSESKTEAVDRSKNCTGNKTGQDNEDQSEDNTGINSVPVEKVDETNNQTTSGTDSVLGGGQNNRPE